VGCSTSHLCLACWLRQPCSIGRTPCALAGAQSEWPIQQGCVVRAAWAVSTSCLVMQAADHLQAPAVHRPVLSNPQRSQFARRCEQGVDSALAPMLEDLAVCEQVLACSSCPAVLTLCASLAVTCICSCLRIVARPSWSVCLPACGWHQACALAYRGLCATGFSPETAGHMPLSESWS